MFAPKATVIWILTLTIEVAIINKFSNILIHHFQSSVEWDIHSQLSSSPWSCSLSFQDASLLNLSCLNCCLTSLLLTILLWGSYSLRAPFVPSPSVSCSFLIISTTNFHFHLTSLLRSSPTSPQETPTSKSSPSHCLTTLASTTSSTLRSPRSRSSGTLDQSFVSPLSVSPIHFHYHCLIQGLHRATWTPMLSSLSASKTPSFLSSL